MEELVYLKQLFPVKVEGDLLFNALKDKQLLNAVRNAYDHETTNFDLCRMVNQRLTYADMFDWKAVAKTINACAKEVEYIDNINTTLNKSARKIWSNKVVKKLEENLKNRGLNTVDQATYNAYLSYRDCIKHVVNKKYANKSLTPEEENFVSFAKKISHSNKEESLILKQKFSTLYKGKDSDFAFLFSNIPNA